ncbi:MAG: PhoH family protein [Thermoanaerobaculia bacterium]|nr:PhoH family protein [Thermoanaerobaculia bacterium]
MSPTPTKIFVLDTSVILYDAHAFTSFEEHDVAIPITVLEELDRFKKGEGVINLQARGFLREIDRLSERADIRDWIPMNGSARGRFRVIGDEGAERDAAEVFGRRSEDHQILNAAMGLVSVERSRRVVLVSKDINLRIKARSLGLPAEDYENVRISDLRLVYGGSSEREVGDDLVDRLYQRSAVEVEELPGETPEPNHYLILRGASKSGLAFHNPATRQIERVRRRTAQGISPRNAEQTFALHALLSEEIPLVSISGPAGTGKTLLALAGALAQSRSYRQIYLTRPVVPLSNRDLGYLPGDIDSKISPYMQPLWDNLGLIKSQYKQSDREFRRIDEMLESDKLHVLPLAYIRGRSLSHIFFIVDEAQNLTPHEIKTIITRAGEGTKIVFTGDIFQIDTPYLDSHSNGLSYLIDKIRGHPLHAHIHLTRGERSELANLASELL